MSYGYFSKYEREVVRVFQIREHHAKIVKLGRYVEKGGRDKNGRVASPENVPIQLKPKDLTPKVLL